MYMQTVHVCIHVHVNIIDKKHGYVAVNIINMNIIDPQTIGDITRDSPLIKNSLATTALE